MVQGPGWEYVVDNSVVGGEVEQLGVEFLFYREGFRNQDFFFNMGMNAEVLFKCLELG